MGEIGITDALNDIPRSPHSHPLSEDLSASTESCNTLPPDNIPEMNARSSSPRTISRLQTSSESFSDSRDPTLSGIFISPETFSDPHGFASYRDFLPSDEHFWNPVAQPKAQHYKWAKQAIQLYDSTRNSFSGIDLFRCSISRHFERFL